MHRVLGWTGLVVGLAALGVQFLISMQLYFENGRDVFGALGMFFSYYTILTNIVLLMIYLSDVTSSPHFNLFRLPVVRGLMAANMVLVALFVYFVLRHLSVLEGLFYICDIALHYVTPTLYLAWWLTGRHGALRYSILPIMLAPTLVYFLYAMARGLWVREYPYPILNAIDLGYGQVLINAMFMTLGLAVLMVGVVLADTLLARQNPQAN